MASGNTATFLNDVFDKNSKALNTLSDLMGFIADASAVGSTIISVVDAFENMGQDPLQPILDALRRDFQQLQADQKAENIIARRTNQVNALADARAIMADLNNLISAHPPLDESARDGKVETCISTLQKLSPEDPLWMAPFNDQVFWNDAGLHMWVRFVPVAGGSFPVDTGYGEQAPPASGTGEVFNYFYILPAYMEAKLIFITVAAGLFPGDFGQRYADHVLRPAAKLLQDRHDKIMSGITQLFPGHLNHQMLIDALDVLARAASSSNTVVPSQVGITPLVDPPSTPFPVPPPAEIMGGVNIEYGAVEKFSGVSSMGLYKITIDEINTMVGDAAFNKFQLRLLKKAKEVYVNVGLQDVWNVINDLKGIVGDAPLPRPNFADWSVKNILDTARIPRRADGLFHLLDLVKFIQGTVPHDIATAPKVSLRGLLLESTVEAL